ncbi:MAG: FtsK/SpoIIIE domain-containing protein [Pirellulaceae bacterium]
MIDSSPKPLPRQRLERLIHGLRERMSSSAQKMSEEVDQLSEQITVLEGQHEHQLRAAVGERNRQRDVSTTEWDETLNTRWDDAEMRSFKAVFETADREGQLRRAAKSAVDAATAEAKKRIADIEQRFLRSKDVPIKQLNAYRASNSQLLDELNHVEAEGEAALAQRSLRAPKVDTPELELPAVRTAAAAQQALKSAIGQAREHCHRLANHPVAKFFESVWWWLICGVVFCSVTAGLTLAGILPLLGAVLAAVACLVVLVITSLIGIRPWLKRAAAAEYPKLRSHIGLGRRLHELGVRLSIEENDTELKRLAAKRDERFEQAKTWRDNQAKEISAKLENDLIELRTRAAKEKVAASEYLTSSIQQTDARFTARLAQEALQAEQAELRLDAELSAYRNEIKSRIDELSRGGALRLQVASQKAIKIFSRSRRWCGEYFPSWERLESEPALWPASLSEPVLPLGNLPLTELMPESVRLDAGAAGLNAPLLFTPLQDDYLTITGDPNQPAVAQLVRELVMRALTTLPAGKTQVCVIDPPGLGRDFGWLMHLSDFDPSLVTHRVWTQPAHIARQLETLARSAEDFIQQSLRNQYRTIVEYNREAGALAEPFRLLVWSSLPSGLDDQSWKSLQSLLDTGARCGIIPMLVIDPALAWPSAEHREFVMRRGTHLTLNDDGRSFRIESAAIASLPIAPLSPAAPELSQSVIQEVGRRALLSSRVEVPLEKMLPSNDERWQADSSQCLEIPIGQSGVGRTHALKLGIGTAQHAIIAGKTGSGKSSLLHAMITSAIMKYSPERLRLVLLDFKKGVEFQVYSDSGIPHADIIGIESHREFGLSALEYIDGCMQRRGESFRGAGVQDLASWNAIHPANPIPRMLLVIDEFQELFVEDDKLSGQASLILDRIVRQGRSFGVHAVLSSQTLAGSYSLPRTTLGQMAVRIALQCDPSDAQIIFAEDNPAAARLKYPGQAVYNDAGGRIEGNQPMQIGWLAKSTQVEWFGQLPQGYKNDDPSTNRLGRTVVYDGNRAATWSRTNADMAISHAAKEVNPEATWCVVGESVAINPAVTFPLTKQTGRNVLLVGADDPQAASVMNAITCSFVRAAQHNQVVPQVFAVQGAKPTDARVLALPAAWQKLDCQFRSTDSRGVDDVIKQVHEMLLGRIESEGGESETSISDAPVLLNLIQLGRLRSLRREDDFASFGESELTADKRLEEILRDGPSHGVYTLLWSESYSTVNRWLSRTALREIEIRILMQMSANDSTNLIDSVAGSRLGDHVMLVFDEATGQEQKFRPFANETLDDLADWSRT